MPHMKSTRVSIKTWTTIKLREEKVKHRITFITSLFAQKIKPPQSHYKTIAELCRHHPAPSWYIPQHNDTQCRDSTPLSSLEHPTAYVKCWRWVKSLWLLLEIGKGSNQLWKTHKELAQNISLSFQLETCKGGIKFPRRFHLIFFLLPSISSVCSGSLR